MRALAKLRHGHALARDLNGPPPGWKRPPPLYPWQRVILGIVAAEPGLTSREVGERYAPTLTPTERPHAALHELWILEGRNLVQRHRHTWSPALLAAIELARAAPENALVATWCSFDAPGSNSHRQRDV